MSDTPRDHLAQVMRDANTPDAWTSPQIVPLDHFAAVASHWFATWLRSDEALSLIRTAVFDPGAVLPRNNTVEDDGYRDYEPVWSWSARAVQARLAGAITREGNDG